jgi:hypothetical protein
MRRLAATLLLGSGALLLVPGAPGGSEVPGDPTPPVVTPTVFGTLGSNGWYTSNVTVNWTVTDPESIILSSTGCNATTLTSDTTGTQLTCRAESDGGITTVSKTIRIDRAPPTLTATPSRPADAGGWYNHALTVSFPGTDATSDIDACTPTQTYNGPDNANISVAGFCRDKAGNRTDRTFTLNYDATRPQLTPAPSRAPNANGWYREPLTVAFPGTDATSGIQSCTGQQTYQGPDNPSVSIPGSCTDKAGNTADASFSFKYDQTSPTASATTRPPDANGWYRRPLTVTYVGTDAISGIQACTPQQSYEGPDSANASVPGACTDKAGNTTDLTLAVRYDQTAPTVVPAPSRSPNANGWYRQPLTVSFSGTDTASGIESCTPPQSYQGPDNPRVSIPGSCTDKAGNSASSTFALRYDESAPTVTAVPARAPDSNGWYTRPLRVSFSGVDTTSEVEVCSSTVHSGPDDPSAAVTGTCRDSAGNEGHASFPFKYDATAPRITNVRTSPGNRMVRLSWAASPDTQLVEVRRAPGRKGESESVVYRGSANTFRDAGLTVGRRYRYRVTGFDAAANTTSESTAITAAGALFSPAPGEQVSAPPRLRWTPVQGADYYNLQLIRGRRVLSVWPIGPSCQLRRTWTYKGRRHRLRPGVYRWYVWPGFGPIADARYGRLIGSSRFVVRG